MSTLTIASHIAHLHPMTGSGLLVLPDPSADVADTMPGVVLSLQEAEWREAIAHLDGMGWEPSEGEDGGLAQVGHLADGRPVVALYGREPITSDPTFAEMADAWADLYAEAGVLPC